jgi:hypothetical protein
LEAVTGGKWDKCFKETWALNLRFNIFKPDAPLANIVEDVRKLGTHLIKQDLTLTVGWAGNSLDTNQHYCVGKDLYFIAEITSNTDVGFVKILSMYDKLWINGRVRSVNL